MGGRLRRAVLAAALSALGASGFVPGGLTHAPHVEVRPAISGPPRAGGRAGAVAPPPTQGRARGPPAVQARSDDTEFLVGPGWIKVVEKPNPEAAQQKLSLQDQLRPTRTPAKATDVISEWAGDVARAEAEVANATDGGKRQRHLWFALRVLDLLGRSAAAGDTQNQLVLGLKTDNETDGVLALASVTSKEGMHPTLGMIKVVDIGEFMVKPTADQQRGLGGELLRRILAWAAANGHMVTMSKFRLFEEYYKSLGVATNDIMLDNLVYSEAGPEEAIYGKQFVLANLDL